MAFGFTRASGTSRNYIATGQTAFDAGFSRGQAISRRQYDAYVTRLGRRKHLPGYAQIRDADRALEELVRNLERAGRAAQSEFEREAVAQARESAHVQARVLRTAKLRRDKQAAGQRRYNVMVKALRTARAEAGEPLTYRQAQAEMRAIGRDLRSKNPARRASAIAAMGGGEAFREAYAAAYGRTVNTITNTRGERFNQIVLPSGRTIIQRAA